ncbi:hypothetical protein [Salsipaludibacter albus]|uniref:hypothetical protein n=1 Tax=Salsipaludibacter albus TaxID=2849650 RepID=UPI001EE48902|nr:hypothetical protein [Salsipaludibacter albus]MBY5162499.1 hypothetical protein [Salsipaludibacter albus]
MDPVPAARPVRRGPVPRGLLVGIALVSLLVGLGVGWVVFRDTGGDGPSLQQGTGDGAEAAAADLAAMCAALAVPGALEVDAVEQTDVTVDPAIYRASAISNLALAAAREDPELDPVISETGADMREHLGRRDYAALADDLDALAETC